VNKPCYMLETPSIRRYSSMSHPSRTVSTWAVKIRSVRAISRKGPRHPVKYGFYEVLATAVGEGILRGHTQGSLQKQRDEDMVHTSWRHGELYEL